MRWNERDEMNEMEWKRWNERDGMEEME